MNIEYSIFFLLNSQNGRGWIEEANYKCCYRVKEILYVTLGFHREADENCALRGQ